MQSEKVNVEELGIKEYPKEWNTLKIKEIGKVILGTTPSTKDEDNWNGIVPFITPGDITGYKIRNTVRTISEQGLDEKRKLPKNSITVSCIGNIGRVGITQLDLAMSNQQINSIVPHEKVADNYFVLFLIKYFGDEFENYASKTTVPILNKTNFSNIKLEVPPLPEQQKIASILSTVQDAIEQTEAVIQASHELKKSMMKHLFTYGPVPVDQTDQVELEETDVGQVPLNWEIQKLDEISDITSGGTPSRKKKEYWENGDIPWVKTGEVDYGIIDDTEEKITKEGLNNSSAKLFPNGTVLIAMYGQGVTRGRVAKLGLDATSNQACAAFLNLKGITNDYLFYALQYEYERLRSYAHGANQKNLSATLLKQFRIAIPDQKNQTSIVNSLSSIDQKMGQEIDKKLSLVKLFDSLLENLMTAKVRV